MFCSECGTKIKDDAKFCFNCGAKITENSAEAEREVPEEFLFYVEGKLLESYVEGEEPTTDLFYKKAKFYEVEEKQVDEIIREYEAKIAKLETFTDSIYEHVPYLSWMKRKRKKSTISEIPWDLTTKKLKNYYPVTRNLTGLKRNRNYTKPASLIISAMVRSLRNTIRTQRNISRKSMTCFGKISCNWKHS